MPGPLITIGRLLGGTLLQIATSLMTSSMVEWAFWWLAEKLVAKSDPTWDDELLARMKKERDLKLTGEGSNG